MRFTLSKSEILRGYKSFTRVITTGKSVSAPPIRCYFTSSESISPRVLAGFSVSRNFKRAVDRNKAKRFMRESYRLNRHVIERGSMESKRSLDLVFMYTGLRTDPLAKMTFKDVNVAMEKLVAMISIGRDR